MKPCPEFDVLLSLRAARALAPADAEKVEAHLAVCPACRTDAAATEDVLALVRLPPPSAEELQLLAGVPARIAAEVHGADRRRGTVKRLAVAALVAAAAVLVLLAPALLRRAPTVDPAAVPAGAVADAAETEPAPWEDPDVETLWDDAAIAEVDATPAAYGGGTVSAALSALDAGDGY